MPFVKLHLAPPILRALSAQGYTDPTPIQAKAIPVIIEGKDVLGIAQTGTGKTAAFALPILHRLSTALPDKTERGHRHARVLVLSPTRELATQIGESFATYGLETGLSHTVIFGGVSQYHQVRALQHGVDILIATPGRLIDLLNQRLVNLTHVQTLVLDEADRMLDMGFIEPIRKIVAALPAAPKRQTLLFSATMPTGVAKLAAGLLHDPVRVTVSHTPAAAPKIEQWLFHVSQNDKQALLTTILRDPACTRVVVFTKTKHGADRVGKRLSREGIRCEAIHGNKAQNQRTRALDSFRAGRATVLVATDVAARGLDVDNITHVINMDLPMDPEAYVHRIGRTGRAGAKGIAIAFCDHAERGLLRDIERLQGKPIPTRPLPPLVELTPMPDTRAGHDAGDRRGPRSGQGPGPGSGHGSGHGPRRGYSANADRERAFERAPTRSPHPHRSPVGTRDDVPPANSPPTAPGHRPGPRTGPTDSGGHRGAGGHRGQNERSGRPTEGPRPPRSSGPRSEPRSGPRGNRRSGPAGPSRPRSRG
jgi:ATP-dependent RNA helicase RhlE